VLSIAPTSLPPAGMRDCSTALRHARAGIVAGILSANTGASAGGATIAYSFFCLDFWDCLEDFLYG
jgi:hypothetical protein